MAGGRVLYSFPRILGRAGVGTTAFHQVAGLVAGGFDVVVAAKEVERVPDGVARVVRTMPASGVRVPHRLIGGRAVAFHDLVVSALVRRHRFDAVHGWPLGCRRTFRAARARGAATIREVPNTHATHARRVVAAEEARIGCSTLGPPAALDRFEALELAEYELADLVLVPSELARETFLAGGVPAERLALHRYGYDHHAFATPAAPPPHDEFTALFVGRGQPRKGLHLALEAWRRSNQPAGTRFLVCGAIDEPYRRALQADLSAPGVEVLGPRPDVPDVMRSADVLVLPSVEEGSALVTYEAQAAGLALLVSDATGARFEHGVHGFSHEPGDVDALTAHLRELATDRVALDRMRAAALDNARTLTWEDAGRELAEIYERALDATARP
jgi:glycosyltransferase involved in cell wall biosynthesis